MRVGALAILLAVVACERAEDARVEPEPPTPPSPRPPANGFLGIKYVMHAGRVYVEQVLPGTPAEQVGIVAGDVITTLDDKPIETTDELQKRIFSARPGHVARLVVERDGSTIQLAPRLAAWPVMDRDVPAPRSRP